MRRAIDAGALGYLLKDSPARELADAVRRVHAGHQVINSDLAAEGARRLRLTDRERQVMLMIAAGDGAARERGLRSGLGFLDSAVRNYLSEPSASSVRPNRVDASRIAQRAGWLWYFGSRWRFHSRALP